MHLSNAVSLVRYGQAGQSTQAGLPLQERLCFSGQKKIKRFIKQFPKQFQEEEWKEEWEWWHPDTSGKAFYRVQTGCV